ncbi:MAG: radical SAM protein [Desulfobulbaceae bacterium]|nr:radical SAM protein [Desulfobulbaceae bacterium]
MRRPGGLEPYDAVDYVEKVIRIIISNGNTSLYIQFFGGEPLINWGTLHHVIKYFGEGDNFGIKIKYSVVTNGSLVDIDIARTLRKHNVDVIVSFDSLNDTGRRFANDEPANDRILSGVKALKDAGNNVVFNSVLGRTTFDAFDNDVIHNAVIARVFEIGVLLDLDPDFYQEYSAKDIIDKLWDVFSYGSKKGVIVTGYWHMIFQQMLAFKWCYRRYFKTCSAAGCQLSIQPTGSVFPCKASSTCYGSIKDINEILTSSTYMQYALKGVVSLTDCLGCEIEGFCGGFCLGPLEVKYGDINVVEKSTCAVYRGIVDKLITNVDPDYVKSYYMSSNTVRGYTKSSFHS